MFFVALLMITARRWRDMTQEILCEVNNCKFWKSGDRCGAKSIYVVSQKGKQAKSSEETDCRTFVPRD